MINKVVFIFILFISTAAFAQNYQKHKVEKGETIAYIAQKYSVTPYDIYQLNPDSQSGLKPSIVLLIPKKISGQKASIKVQTHKVWPKETLYSIVKKYNISEVALKKANPFLENEGLQIGQILTIPASTASNSVVPHPEKVVYHEVLPKETKFSIAKRYKITVQELEIKNPEIIPNLIIGYKLLVKGTASKTDKIVVVEPKKETPKKVYPKVNPISYEIKPKETLYSLAKMAGLTQEELVLLNPTLANGVEIGMIIKVPENVVIPREVEVKKVYSTLSKNLNSRKKLVLLLPFNLTKIEGDTLNTISARLKKDKFLNMTLDFYAGAMIAIDSAKTIGIPVDVSIFDSQETKNSSNIVAIHQQKNLDGADAVIGPFYQNNVEQTAALLGDKNIPVISPLSKDIGNSFPNLYQTIPTSEVLKRAVFDYLVAKSGNIIAVVDKKKESAKQFLEKNYPVVKFPAFLENGSVSMESLKSLLVKGKMNYILLATENTGMIKWTMATLISSLSTYSIELVIMEPNETLDTDEINFEHLTKLRLMYPSISRENESAAALVFEKEFRKKNKISPNMYATRGFDLTFDTIMRLNQSNTFQQTADSIATEQVDNKFEYYKKADGGFTNKGVYILYYDTDLRIKEAN